MILSGHEIGILKSYVEDLIQQARHEELAGWKRSAYTSDEAMMDLLALLDDRVESEGVQVGLSQDFPHRMWEICRQAEGHVKDQFWLVCRLGPAPSSKVQVRRMVYEILLEYLQKDFRA